jgi:hypothetical protein|nr:MAG TPA: hypothetical protein [Caudoviricetes sp.]
MRIVRNKSQNAKSITASAQYSKAVDHIQCAMQELSKIAKTDEVAKDSITNLGVVMFDLRHDK